MRIHLVSYAARAVDHISIQPAFKKQTPSEYPKSAFFDLKAGFDSVHREVLPRYFLLMGVHKKFITSEDKSILLTGFRSSSPQEVMLIGDCPLSAFFFSFETAVIV